MSLSLKHVFPSPLVPEDRDQFSYLSGIFYFQPSLAVLTHSYFIYFFGHAHCMRKFLGQGLNL